MARARNLLVVASLALVGCSRRETPPVALAPAREAAGLTIYAAQGGEVTDPVVDAYRSRNPGLGIQIIRGGMGEMLSRIRAERE